MLRGQEGQVAREFADGGFGFGEAEGTGLLEGGERVVDSCYGVSVGCDVEVRDGLGDQVGGGFIEEHVCGFLGGVIVALCCCLFYR